MYGFANFKNHPLIAISKNAKTYITEHNKRFFRYESPFAAMNKTMAMSTKKHNITIPKVFISLILYEDLNF